MWYPILSTANLLFAVGQFIIGAINSKGPDGIIFINNTFAVSAQYYNKVTPAGWTFSIWGFIYAWQALWVLYSVVNIFRKNKRGSVSENPRFLSLSLFIFGMLACSLNVAWEIAFDRQWIEVALALPLAYSLSLYSALFVSYRALDRASPSLVEQNQVKDIWLTRALVHNGIGIQATWVTLGTLISLSIVLTYSGNKLVSVDNAATVVYSIVSAELLTYSLTDLILLDRYTRYTFTPYMVVIVALIGGIDQTYEPGERNSIFKVVLLAVAITLFLTKIIVSVYRHLTRQRYVTNYSPTIGEIYHSGQLE